MRLTKLYLLTHNLIDQLNLKIEKNANTGKYRILNIGKVNLALNLLNEFPYFKDEFARLNTTNSPVNIYTEEAVLDPNTVFSYQAELKLIQEKLKLISLLHKDFSPQLDENTLCISAPQNMSLPEFSSFVTNTTKALNMLNNMDGMEGQITFKSVEYGSDWFNFIIEGVALLAGIKALLKIVNSVVLESITTYKTIKSINLIENSNITLQSLQKKLSKKYIDDDETFNNLSPENTERVINAATLLASEISKGAKTEMFLLNQAKSESEILIEKQIANCVDELKLLKENTTSNEQE